MQGSECAKFLTEKIQNLKIAVIGDVMLDRYFYGDVKRISPEAPVPVNHVKRIESVLGGAANVAANLAHLGCQAYIGGVTGDDANRKLLEEMTEVERLRAENKILKAGNEKKEMEIAVLKKLQEIERRRG